MMLGVDRVVARGDSAGYEGIWGKSRFLTPFKRRTGFRMTCFGICRKRTVFGMTGFGVLPC